jgi:hypothetical protein
LTLAHIETELLKPQDGGGKEILNIKLLRKYFKFFFFLERGRGISGAQTQDLILARQVLYRETYP